MEIVAVLTASCLTGCGKTPTAAEALEAAGLQTLTDYTGGDLPVISSWNDKTNGSSSHVSECDSYAGFTTVFDNGKDATAAVKNYISYLEENGFEQEKSDHYNYADISVLDDEDVKDANFCLKGDEMYISIYYDGAIDWEGYEGKYACTESVDFNRN